MTPTAQVSGQRLIPRALLLAALLGSAACADVSCGLGLERRLVIAAGPSQSAQHCVARAYATDLAAEAPEHSPSVLSTDGSLESLMALRDGRAALAIATADVLAQAVNGEGPFAGATVSALTVATVFTSALHVIVPEGSPVRAFSDIRGRAVAAGPPGSGMDLTASRVIGAALLDRGTTVRSLPASGLHAALQGAELAAVFWVDGVPAPALDAAGGRKRPTLRLLSTASVVPLLQRRYGQRLYRVTEIPRGTYGSPQPTATVGISSVLVARGDLEEGTAFNAARVLNRHAADVARECPPAATLLRRGASQPEPAALHPGAARFYRSVQLTRE